MNRVFSLEPRVWFNYSELTFEVGNIWDWELDEVILIICFRNMSNKGFSDIL